MNWRKFLSLVALLIFASVSLRAETCDDPPTDPPPSEREVPAKKKPSAQAPTSKSARKK